MFLKRLATIATTVAIAVATTVATAAPAAAHTRHHPLGTQSLAAVLAADGSGFDRNPRDFDIVDNAVQAVLATNSSSAVAVLADGKVALTAFLPTDQAFRRLAYDLSGTWYDKESDVFGYLAKTLGVPTIENVLLYHVVPGATLTYRQARCAGGTTLKTALAGATITIKVKRPGHRVSLIDNDPNATNAVVVRRDLNRGNLQIAHGINRVLRPLDL